MANQNQDDFDRDGSGDACDNGIDSDGTPNNSDDCKFTYPDEVLDPTTGCSVDQLCPCEGPRGTIALWKHHCK